MRYLHSYLATAIQIMEAYRGDMPFGTFIKNYFAQQKKYGSTDRKAISALCYNAYRTGGIMAGKRIEERLMTGLFLLTDSPGDALSGYNSGWNDHVQCSIDEKLQLIHATAQTIFPFNNELSAQVHAGDFNRSFLQQPDLFIRIRPGFEQKVKHQLQAAGVSFKEITAQCLAFANGTQLDKILEINKEVVIQDMSSQRTAAMFALMKLPAAPHVWDCCAASGGKSIMAYDILTNALLTITDVRKTIVYNLQKRFREAGINNYRYYVTDVTNAAAVKNAVKDNKYDLVICDAPCSGSGTWARTPEQLTFFNHEDITRYSKLQQSITANLFTYIKQGGYLLYITCSVFAKENEAAVQFILQQSTLSLIKTELLEGYYNKADSMFAALFINNQAL